MKKSNREFGNIHGKLVYEKLKNHEEFLNSWR